MKLKVFLILAVVVTLIVTTVAIFNAQSSSAHHQPGHCKGKHCPSASATPTPTASPTPTPTETVSPTPTPTETAPTNEPVLNEEFTSVSSVMWNYYVGTQGNNNAYFRQENVSAVDGNLLIEGRLEDYGGRTYTSGDIRSYNTLKWATPSNYFRAEIRAKVPMGMGMWAAPLWFRPVNSSGSTVCGEIDLLETYGNQMPDPYAASAIHQCYDAQDRHRSEKIKYSSLPNPDPRAWHTYVIEKVPGSITTYVDGVQLAHFSSADATWYNTYFENPDIRWALRSNLQIGSNWAGYPDETTAWGTDDTKMYVDYIRVWNN